MPTPTLIQRWAWNSSGDPETGGPFFLPIQNATLANNCLILAFQVSTTGTGTIKVSDNAGNTWPTSANYTVTDSGNGVKFCIFILPNAAAGVTIIEVGFGSSGTTKVNGFLPAFQEWANIATSSPVDKESSTLVSPSIGGTIQSGSITTTAAGDLILQFITITDNGINGMSGAFDGLTNLTPDSSGHFTLFQAKIDDGYACQYYVQPAAGAINPGFSGTWTASASSWPSITIALFAASAGTLPSATAPRIIGGQWYRLSQADSPTPYVVQSPLLGTAGAINCSIQNSLFDWSATSGSSTGSWGQIVAGSAYPTGAHITGATPAPTDLLTLTGTLSTGLTAFGICLDMVNVSSFDTYSAQTGGSFPAGPTPANTITPGVSQGIAFSVMGLGTGPPSGIVTPSGAVFLSPTYTGQTDGSYMSSGDCWGAYYFSTNAMQSWVYTDTQASGNTDALVMTFAGSAPPAGPPLLGAICL